MISPEEQEFLRAALRKRLLSRTDLEEAVQYKRKNQSRDSLLKILVRLRLLDVKDARKLQQELAIQPRRRRTSQRKLQQTTTIGPYRVEKFLGAGAMGAVYIAIHDELKRRVALKVLLAEQPSERAISRFKREARLTARLSHPNIVRVHDAGESDGKHYIAMDLIEGQSLDEALTLGEVDLEQAAYIIQKVAEALFYAHEQGVIHRDIKPSNILLETSGQPKVTDFGLAVLEDRDSVRLTKTGAAVGTPAYMAPEQVLGDADRVGPHTDVYGLGAAFYEILTGRPPFRGSTFLELANNICQKEPNPIRDYNLEVPEELEIICLKALEKDLDMRYRTADELAADLGHYLNKKPIQATRPNLFQKAKKWMRRHRGLSFGIGLAVLVTILAALFYLSLPGHLKLDTVPSNATVILGGNRYRTPVDDTQFPPGTYELKFDHPGYKESIPGIPTLTVSRNAVTQYTFNLFSTKGTLVVRSDPPGATVELLEKNSQKIKDRGTTTFVKEVPAGTYTLKLSLTGHESQTLENIQVFEGNQVTKVPLVILPADEGRLTLKSDPSDISVELLSEGLPRRTLLGPFSQERIGSGQYNVNVSKSGYLSRQLKLSVQRGETAKTRVCLQSLLSASNQLPGPILGSPVVADMDGDGLEDIVVLTRPEQSSTSELLVIRRGCSGDLLWTHKTKGTRVLGVADVDNDRFLDVLIGGPNEIECRQGVSGYRLWRKRLSNDYPSGEFACFDATGTAGEGQVYTFDRRQFIAIDIKDGQSRVLKSVPGQPQLPPKMLALTPGGERDWVLGVYNPLSREHLVLSISVDGQENFRWVAPGKVIDLRIATVQSTLRRGLVVHCDRGPLFVLSSNGQELFPIGDPSSRFEMIDVGRISGAGTDDIVTSQGGRIQVLSGRQGQELWSHDGQRALAFSSKQRGNIGQVWIDGRLYDGKRGKYLGGAAAEPWISRRISPLQLVDMDKDGAKEVLTIGRNNRSLVRLLTNKGDLVFRAATRGVKAMAVDEQSQSLAILEDGRSLCRLSANGRRVWQIQSRDDVHNITWLGDIDKDSSIDLAIAGKNRLYALSGQNGRVLWTRNLSVASLKGLKRDFDNDGIPDLITSQPAILLSGKTGVEIRALGAIGGGAQDHSQAVPRPLVLPGQQAILCAEASPPHLACYDLESGTLAWNAPGHVRSVSLLGQGAETTSCVLQGPRRLALINIKTGEERWNVEHPHTILGHCTHLSSSPPMVFFVDNQGLLRALSAVTGKTEWSRVLPQQSGSNRRASQPIIWPDERSPIVMTLAPNGLLMGYRVQSGLSCWTRTVEGQRKAQLKVHSWPNVKKSVVLVEESDGSLLAIAPQINTKDRRESPRERLHSLSELIKLADSKELATLEPMLRSLCTSNSQWLAPKIELAQLYLKMKKAESARSTADEVLQEIRNRNPNVVNISTLFILVEALILLDRFDEAAVQLEELRRRNRTAASQLAVHAGNLILDRSELRAAYTFFKQAVEADPRSSAARRGRALSSLGLKPIREHIESIDLDLKLARIDFNNDLQVRAVAAMVEIWKGRVGQARSILNVPSSALNKSKLSDAFQALQRATKSLELQNRSLAQREFISAMQAFGLKHGWGPLWREALKGRRVTNEQE